MRSINVFIVILSLYNFIKKKTAIQIAYFCISILIHFSQNNQNKGHDTIFLDCYLNYG